MMKSVLQVREPLLEITTCPIGVAERRQVCARWTCMNKEGTMLVLVLHQAPLLVRRQEVPAGHQVISSTVTVAFVGQDIDEAGWTVKLPKKVAAGQISGNHGHFLRHEVSVGQDRPQRISTTSETSSCTRLSVITNHSALDKISLELSDMLIAALVHGGSGILLLFLLGLVFFSLRARLSLWCLRASLRFPFLLWFPFWLHLPWGCLDFHGLRIAGEVIV